MKKIFGLLFMAFIAITIQAQNIELKDITSGKYYPKRVQSVVSSFDGESYYQADSKNTMIVKYSYKTGLATDTVFNVKKARECTLSSFQGFIMSPDEKRLLLFNDYESIYRHSYKANFHYFDIRRNMVQKLTTNQAKQSVPTFSRDGRMLAYVLDNNIWLAKFDFDTESQITTDGKVGHIINGMTDWVYEEEFGTTSIMDFSEDNRLLAFIKFEESEVSQYSIQNYNNQLYPSLFSFKYPKAGEKNSEVTCQVFDLESKTIRKINLPDNVEYIPRIQFLPYGDELAVMTLNRDQNDFNMYYSNARSTVSRLILRDNNKYYVDSENLKSIHFFNNQFTYLSEKSGYSHIHLYSNTGVEQKQLTSGDFDVTEILAVDSLTHTVYYESAEEGPLYRAVHKVDIKKGATTKLSSKKGYNKATFSNNGKYYVNSYATTTSVPVISLHNSAGKELRVLEDNATLKAQLAKIRLSNKEFITVKAQDGTDLNAYILKPADFSSTKKYPLLMVQYSGPNSQQVEDRFVIDWVDYLVTQGFVVACVDGRGTGARGEEFRKSTYMNLGIKESDDQIAAAKYFGTLPYIDKSKIAIWGWSYGGYNVLMSMSRSKGIFNSGIAVAPVTDWRFYDSVYTERFMRTPQQNASGYNAASALMLASKLEGNLLLVHGSADDNVHFQNSMEYIDALIKADKQFDMFIFPDKDHSIRGAANRTYLFQKIISFLKKM